MELCLEFLPISDGVEKLKNKQTSFFGGKEKQYQEFIMKNLPDICQGLKLSKIKNIREQEWIKTDGFKIVPDILTFHEDNSISIFEIKCSNGKTSPFEQMAAIGQILLYRNVINAIHNPEYIRCFVVDQKIHYRTMCAFVDNELPITLLEVNKDKVFIPYSDYLFGDKNGKT